MIHLYMYPLMWTMPMASCFLKKTFTKTLWETNQSQFLNTNVHTVEAVGVHCKIKVQEREEMQVIVLSSLKESPLLWKQLQTEGHGVLLTESQKWRKTKLHSQRHPWRDALDHTRCHWWWKSRWPQPWESSRGWRKCPWTASPLAPVCKRWHEDLCDFFFLENQN